MRLNKFIANSGHCSRRKADELISEGHVHVNNHLINQLGSTIDPAKDTVAIDGKPITLPTQFTTILLHKPTDYTTSKFDAHAKKTIYELLPKKFQTLHPVGRLDKDTEGLLILTNNGDLTYKLTHPKHDSAKTYEVHVNGQPSKNQIETLEAGIDIEEETDGTITIYHTEPCKITLKKPKHTGFTTLHITLHEGRKRQIRKMFKSINHPVKYLKRLEMGPYKLGKLPKGEWEEI